MTVAEDEAPWEATESVTLFQIGPPWHRDQFGVGLE